MARWILAIVVAIGLTGLAASAQSVRTVQEATETQGEQRFTDANKLSTQDLTALSSLAKSGKYSQAEIDELRVRVWRDDFLLLDSAALVMDMELRAIQAGKTSKDMYTDFQETTMALRHYDRLKAATMHDRIADHLPQVLIH